jgi:hypothetical protein
MSNHQTDLISILDKRIETYQSLLDRKVLDSHSVEDNHSTTMSIQICRTMLRELRQIKQEVIGTIIKD